MASDVAAQAAQDRRIWKGLKRLRRWGELRIQLIDAVLGGQQDKAEALLRERGLLLRDAFRYSSEVNKPCT